MHSCKHTHFQTYFVSSYKHTHAHPNTHICTVMLAAFLTFVLCYSPLSCNPASLKSSQKRREGIYIYRYRYIYVYVPYSPCTYTLLNISSFSSATTSPTKWTDSPLLCQSVFSPAHFKAICLLCRLLTLSEVIKGARWNLWFNYTGLVMQRRPGRADMLDKNK